ncbi:two-component sensor histidine kinase, partial [Salmonella enterica subsp. enterica serovar Typhimurium]|uniref:sensor histidine kinase n=1 Tax=Salmonella enterica TaxID=28901 RepID=UPI000CAC36B3
KEYTAIIREETEHLSLLIKNLFELARLDQSRFVIEREEIRLCDMIQSVADRMEPLFKEKQVTYTVNCADNNVLALV